jgi:hypothetical protein
MPSGYEPTGVQRFSEQTRLHRNPRAIAQAPFSEN